MKINVKHLKKLSRLEFTEEEEKAIQKDLENILQFAGEIDKADVSGTVIKSAVIKFEDLRKDEVVPSISQEDILKNAPYSAKGGFSAGQVIEE